MIINSGVNYVNGSIPTQPSTSDSSTLSTLLTETQINNNQVDSGTKQADFTRMTRQELNDWANTKIRNGDMSLDDGRPFMAMAMKIPVSGGFSGELSVDNDKTRYNFIQKARDGIQGALSRNDEATLDMLKSAMSIMQNHQGHTIGVDISV
ncbi:hypothetical protein [Thalassotalea profundi]|uniref:Uncharacterized protein n=1 Tax=Thalassotalea profundi TaxID=2036687 RepID=A0ABQ3IX19_9GAMM|nr:hypothetical protein [Thalassotalea profundi]GHE93587.1 hypothetical protein GCM10011501_23720 [Thalassotalea profundi]